MERVGDAEVPAGAHLVVTFDGDGQVYGDAGVNRFRGTWHLDGDGLTLGPLVATRRAGTPEATGRETALLAALVGTLRMTLRGGPDAVRLAGPAGEVDLVRTAPADVATALV